MEKIEFSKFITIFILFLIINTSFVSVTANLVYENKDESDLSYKKITSSKNLLFDLKINFFKRIAKFPALSACIIDKDEMIWSKGYGYYDIKNKKEASTDTIYIIASITKTIVGTALMQLWEQELFDLDEDVNSYLPFNLRNPNFPEIPITFRMLLSHTSSLNTNTRNEYYWLNFSEDPPFDFFPMPYLEEFLIPGGKYYHEDAWSDIYKPGERAMYANIGFDILSYLVEIISEKAFLSYCQEYIFEPLEMYNTSFNLSTLNIDNVALPYQYLLGKYYQINELAFLYGDLTPPQPYWKMRAYPAGGLYTTVNDLSHFLIAHMNDGMYESTRILEKETVDLMHSIQPDNRIGYGLAWMEYPISSKYKAMGHGGDIMGVDTWMLYVPSEEIGVIYFANGNPAYGLTPNIGFYTVKLLLYNLFKEGGIKMRFSSNVLSDHPFMTINTGNNLNK